MPAKPSFEGITCPFADVHPWPRFHRRNASRKLCYSAVRPPSTVKIPPVA